MKKKIFSGFLVLALLLGTVQPALAAETAATMKLSATEGTVTVSNASGRSLTVRDNMRLYSGYQVETAANSYAWINLDDTKLIKLDASTEAEIRKSGKKLELLLESGSMYGDVSRPLEADETLDIRTSTAIVGIRGTKFSVAQAKQPVQDTQAADRTTQVQVYEGSVAVTAQQETPETAAVTAGNQLTVHPGTEGTETFAASQLSSGHISGYAAVELVKNPETLENLGIGISPEAARERLAQDQADAARRQAEAEAGKTSLETAAASSAVWGTGSDSTPSGGGGSTTRPEPEPKPDPDPEPEPGPDPTPLPTYTVTFDPNGGSVSPGSLITGTDGKLDSAAAAPVPSRTGYTFLGWFSGLTGGAKADLTAVFTANTTFYAHWEANTYTVTFDPNGGAGGGAVLTDVSGLLTERIADPTRDGYVFDGWYTAASGGTKADLTAAFPADTVLYAQWTALPAYTVTFDPNGGTWDGAGGTPRPFTTAPGGKLAAGSIPAGPVMDGCVLTGWNTLANGTGTEIDPSGYTFPADTTLYAQWLSTTVQVDQELVNNSQAAAQQKIQDLLNHPACTQVTVELAEYTYTFPSGKTNPVSTLILKNSLTVPSGKELVMNCHFQVGSHDDGVIADGLEIDGRTPAKGTLIVNGTLTVNNGISLYTCTDKGVSTVTIGSGGTLTDNTPGTNEIIGNVDNSGTLRIAGTWQLSNGSFTNRGAITGGSISNSSTFTNETGGSLSIGTEFTNNSTFTNRGTFTTSTGASITNHGTLRLEAGSQFTMDAAFHNYGSVTMTGEAGSPAVFSSNSTSSSGGVSNNAGGTIEIGAFGQFENNDSAGGVKNSGTITVNSGGTLITNNSFTNSGTLTNEGTYYGPALTGGTIGGTNADQMQKGNAQP